MGIHCRFHNALDTFIEACQGHLLLRESENSLILGLLQALESGRLTPRDCIFVEVTDDTGFVGCALRTSQETALILTQMPNAAVTVLVDVLADRGVTLHKVSGVASVSEEFADRWSKRFEFECRLDLRLGLYEVLTVNMPKSPGGQMLKLRPEDHAAALRYLTEFERMVDPDGQQPQIHAQKVLDRHIASETLFSWCNDAGVCVSIAAKVRETQNGASISLVYTPPEYRGRGYASSLVAALSQYLLDEGRHVCNLFTDMANPTSNSIYQKIGYRQVATCADYVFESRG